MNLYARAVAWLVPEGVLCAEDQARARTFVFACFGIAGMLTFTTLAYRGLGSELLPPSVAWALCLTLLALPFGLRMSGNLPLIGTLGAALIATAPMIAALTNQAGVHAPMMTLTTLAPVLTAAFVGRVGALVSCTFSLLTIAGAHQLTPASHAAQLTALGLAMLSALSGYFSWLFELERERSRKRIQSSEARLQRLAADAPDIVFRLRVAGTKVELEYVNSAFERILGYPSKRLFGDLLAFAAEVVEPSDLTMLSLHAVRGFEEPLVCRIRAANGREVWLETKLVSSRDDSGALVLEGIGRDVTARKKTERELTYSANHDPLTGLLNRRALEEQWPRCVALAGGAQYGALYIDLDHFKTINDTHGHEAGDALLRAVAKRVTRAVRDDDRVFRVGGDELVVLLIEARTEHGATLVGERVLASLNRPYVLPNASRIEVTASIGLALSSIHGSAEEVLDAADQAMYQAKRQGGGRLCAAPHLLLQSGIRKTRSEDDADKTSDTGGSQPDSHRNDS
jgi:diguanylate cyclase (GGDEF)-like protein/PAS domain S-box-containing protein